MHPVNKTLNNCGKFSNPLENENQIGLPSAPPTPDKSAPSRSPLVHFGQQGDLHGRGNWHDQAGYPNGHAQQQLRQNRAVESLGSIDVMDQYKGNHSRGNSLPERSRVINHIAGSYANTFINNGPGFSGMRLTDILRAATEPLDKRILSSIDIQPMPANRIQPNLANSLQSALDNSIPPVENRNLLPNLNLGYEADENCSFSDPISLLLKSGSNGNLWNNNTTEIPQYGFPVPSQPSHNTLQTTEVDASNVTSSYQVAPIPHYQAKSNCFEVLNFSVESTSQEKQKQDVLSFARSESIKHHSDELLQNIVDSSCATIFAQTREKNDTSKASNPDFDLNKTPQQKRPKKRKHRPKVVIEAKPKRTRKPVTSKNTDVKENPRGKRKYIRKNSRQAFDRQIQDATKETIDPPVSSASKSCRRALNFETEIKGDCINHNIVGCYETMQKINNRAFDLNSGNQATQSCTATGCIPGSKSAVQNGHRNGLMVKTLQAEASNNLAHFADPILTRYVVEPERPHSTMGELQRENSVFQMSANGVPTESYQGRSYSGYSSMPQQIHGGIDEIFFPTQKKHKYNDLTSQLMVEDSHQSGAEALANCNQTKGSKREYHQTAEEMCPPSMNLVDSSLLYQELFQVDKYSSNRINLDKDYPEASKKHKSGKSIKAPCVTIGDGVNDGMSYIGKDVNRSSFPTDLNRGMLISSPESSTNINKSITNLYFDAMAAEYRMKSQHMSSAFQGKAGGRSNGLALLNSTQTTTENGKQQPLAPSKRKAPKNNPAAMLSQKQSAETRQSSSDKAQLRQHKDSFSVHQQSSFKATGPPAKHNYPALTNEIIYQLQKLCLNRKNKEEDVKEQNAVVPYNNNGTVVPHEGLDQFKKRRPRPKVDLDPETTRLWKLLTEKEESNESEGLSKDQEKYWEDERRIFQGRADSFIARMHLVQGDRRFSQWKGSVVDSVIGVFLTQNVSDHLSSSAFMSLAARFPIQPTSHNRPSHRDEISTKEEESDIRVIHTNHNIKWDEKVLSQPVYRGRPTTAQVASRQNVDSISTRIQESILEAQTLIVEDEINSSQDSLDFTIATVPKGIKSCSGSSSEAEESAAPCNPNWIKKSTSEVVQQRNEKTISKEFFLHENGSPTFYESFNQGIKQLEDTEHSRQKTMMERTDSLKSSSAVTQTAFTNNSIQTPSLSFSNYWQQMTSDTAPLEVKQSQAWEEESSSSWPSTASRKSTAEKLNFLTSRQRTESIGKTTTESTDQQNRQLRAEEAPSPEKHALRSTDAVHQTLTRDAANNQYQFRTSQEERTEAIESDSTSITGPAKLSELNIRRQNNILQHDPFVPRSAHEASCFEGRSLLDKQAHLEHTMVKPHLQEQVYSSDKAHGMPNTNISKLKKGKVEGNKKNSSDWESLRKQVLCNCTKSGRTKDSKDSLDYDAVRKAHIEEISDPIKERGMNKMLAERIKDFLNRVVNDHGSIDLEWLRDAPPDKAKEYLLSIRGLGLKSVECVRLLTLHHLAFPVDTNVGRIAVRLGWVPLQPLPESLQLHLLEMYPVLESIQKYLWPRLCKLDQRTLYELHYQMITFGKVFCTKSKPNCNACPMRGECRHFASAFASARLALPGQEERSIVSPPVPFKANKNPLVNSPMLLPSPEKYLNGGPVSTIGMSVPIIEVPATPEPDNTELPESDIEDAFYKDSDAIPTIKLNIEEFTSNLQTYMQENNMELQEGDMSKALVALDPRVDSVPATKLKNVSRLRTEHQVYELPDSHTLLSEMDRREPDDPSPYLLAIWTPGETANSIQPPEQSCKSQETGKMCDKSTCFSCNSIKESNSQTVRGTILIPCRTAMRGSFPLNGTYFQVNEMFADHDTSVNPIDVPRAWIWNLPRRTVYFGTSVTTIFRGLSTEGIQYCFWRGFVCVRGFDQKTRAPRPLMARLHFPASKLVKTKKRKNK